MPIRYNAYADVANCFGLVPEQFAADTTPLLTDMKEAGIRSDNTWTYNQLYSQQPDVTNRRYSVDAFVIDSELDMLNA